MTFAPSGGAHVELDGAPFDGTEVGACIVDAFRAAASRVPAFEGELSGSRPHFSSTAGQNPATDLPRERERERIQRRGAKTQKITKFVLSCAFAPLR